MHFHWLSTVTPLNFVSCRTFLFFTRCDVICDLLQYIHTENAIYLLNRLCGYNVCTILYVNRVRLGSNHDHAWVSCFQRLDVWKSCLNHCPNAKVNSWAVIFPKKNNSIHSTPRTDAIIDNTCYKHGDGRKYDIDIVGLLVRSLFCALTAVFSHIT